MKTMKNLTRCLVSIGAFFALSASSAFAGSESPYGSGGEVTFVGANKDVVHTFTGVGDNSFTLFSEKEVWFLVVGGGGAGGKDCAAGGGGGGFVESNSVVLAAGNYTVTVGAGGQPAASSGVCGGNGGDSVVSFGGVEIAHAIGGGGGAGWGKRIGANGGSGGGSASCGSSSGVGVPGQGNDGGYTTAYNRPNGGGGAGASGGIATGSKNAGKSGDGGDGLTSSISGVSTYYAGGGGGGGYDNNPGTGGLGGGGNGATTETIATRMANIDPETGKTEYDAEAGVDGLGGGGGGGNNREMTGRPGGSGVVVIRMAGDLNSQLEISSDPDGIGSPSPAYGGLAGLSAGDARAVSCGTTFVTKETGTIAYSCIGWKLYDKDDNLVSSGTDTSFTYIHPTPAAFRRLEWQWRKSVAGTILAGDFGSVSPSGTAWYYCDTPVTVTATPNQGIGFAHWTGTLPADIDATLASVTFTPTDPFAMTARFGAAHYEQSIVGRSDILYTFFASGTIAFGRTVKTRLLLVGGGGAGGYDCSGGGGGGGMIDTNDVELAAGTYTITVGAGGQPVDGNTNCGGNGGDSAIAFGGEDVARALGGGGGAGYGIMTGAAGGCGGGGAHTGAGGVGTEGQGYAGGTATGLTSLAGGGGAGGPGEDSTKSGQAGVPGSAGGPGRVSDITGEEVYYAGGGGGGGYNCYEIILNGGIGGGGNGARNVTVAARMAITLPDGRNEYEAECGVDGLGGGGGGANNISGDHRGRPGGRGIVIIRVKRQLGFVFSVH